MRDHELYATILGLTAPWTVERVDADFLGGAVHVWLARTDGAPAQCPECQTTCPIYDHREREWRHLDTCQLQTRLHARVPRGVAGDVRTGQLDAPDRGVRSAGAELQLEHHPQLPQRGDLLAEALHGLLD